MQVGSNIGSGSYGTVHTARRLDSKKAKEEECVAKRAWTLEEIEALLPEDDKKRQKGRHERCDYYWSVEKHCFEKIPPHPGIPPYEGTIQDEQGLEWLVFGKITASADPSDATTAPSMQDLLDLDLADHQENPEDRLINLSAALGVKPTTEK